MPNTREAEKTYPSIETLIKTYTPERWRALDLTAKQSLLSSRFETTHINLPESWLLLTKPKRQFTGYVVSGKPLHSTQISHITTALDLRFPLGRTVAIKFLASHSHYPPKIEYEVQDKVGPRYTIPIYDVIHTHQNPQNLGNNGDEEFTAIIMAFQDPKTRPTVQQMLKQYGRIKPDTVNKITWETAQAVHACAEKCEEIINLDLKPGNLYFDLTDGGVRIGDWGLTNQHQPSNCSSDGNIYGSPAYLSPEGILGQKVNMVSQTYVFGLMVYQMATGELLTKGLNTTETLLHILNTIDGLPEEKQQTLQANGYGTDTIAVVNKALRRNPQDRFPNPLEFAQALNHTIVFQNSLSSRKVYPPNT